MSKRRNKNVKVEETVNNEVNVDVEENETEEDTKEEEEMKENFMFKLGKTAGKVVGGVKKVVTSKPAKIIGGVAIVGATLAAGYKLGKDGFPELGMKDDDTDLDEPGDLIEDLESYNEPEEAVETTEESNE